MTPEQRRAAKAKSNREYYERTRDRIIIRESELRPSAIVELVESLADAGVHKGDKRIQRLCDLYLAIMGEELPTGDQP